MDQEFFDGPQDGAAPGPDAPAPEAESPPEATPSETAAPPLPAAAEPATQPQTQPQPQAQIDPNEYEYLRRQNDELVQDRLERQQREAQQLAAVREFQIKAALETRSKQAREQARAMRAYDEDQADALIARTEAENRDWLLKYHRETQRQAGQRIEAERQVAQTTQYARYWTDHYKLPAEFEQVLVGLPTAQIPQQAYALAIFRHEAEVARYEAEQARREAVARQMSGTRGGAAPVAAGGVPGQAAPDGSFAQLRGAMSVLAPDVYDALTR